MAATVFLTLVLATIAVSGRLCYGLGLTARLRDNDAYTKGIAEGYRRARVEAEENARRAAGVDPEWFAPIETITGGAK